MGQTNWRSSGDNMTGRSGRSIHALALALAVASWTAPPVIAQTPPTQTLGNFQWDTATADVLMQQVSRDRMVVQVRILTHTNTSPGRHQTRPVPTEAMEAWVLLDDGRALEQTPRQPAKGSPPVGVESAGDRHSFVSFGFKSPTDPRIAAVVVRMEDQFHLFPVARAAGSSVPRGEPRVLSPSNAR
jgi:hypothetical protein